MSPVSVGGELSVGRLRSVGQEPARACAATASTRPTHAAGGRSAYVGELPPFEAGADDVHLTIVGTVFDTPLGPLTVDETTAKNILTDVVRLPAERRRRLHLRRTARRAARRRRSSRCATPPTTSAPTGSRRFMFIWDFIALDDDPTSMYGADGAQIAQIIEDYDGGLGELLDALDDQGADSTAPTSCSRSTTARSTRTTRSCSARTGGAQRPTASWPRWSTAQGAAMGLDTSSYALLNEDGDAQIYARRRRRRHRGRRRGAGRRRPASC